MDIISFLKDELDLIAGRDYKLEDLESGEYFK